MLVLRDVLETRKTCTVLSYDTTTTLESNQYSPYIYYLYYAYSPRCRRWSLSEQLDSRTATHRQGHPIAEEDFFSISRFLLDAIVRKYPRSNYVPFEEVRAASLIPASNNVSCITIQFTIAFVNNCMWSSTVANNKSGCLGSMILRCE